MSNNSSFSPITKRDYLTRQLDELSRKLKFITNVHQSTNTDSSRYVEVSLDELSDEINKLQRIARMNIDQANELINERKK